MTAINNLKLINNMCQQGFIYLYATSHERMPTARGSLRSPTPSAQIQGLLGAEPQDPWLHPNISLGCT